MAVRKTENKIPVIPGFTIDDLGQHAASLTNAQVQLISYLASPLGTGILQNYVVFVEDAAVQPNVASYEWVFNNNGTPATVTTTNGVASYTPPATGSLSVTVNLKDSGNITLHSVVLQQQVADRNLELEQLIDQEGARSPTAGNPVISREVINGLRTYADTVAAPDTDNAENRLILSICYSNASTTAAVRNALLESCSAAIETNIDTFFTTAQRGIGIAKVRPHIACMYILSGGNPLIPVTLIPSSGTVPASVKTAFNGLTPEQRIDLFNLLRFPKSNIKICKLILDGVKTLFTESFAVIMANRTKARRLISEYEKGPYTPPTGSGTSDLTSTSTGIFNNSLLAIWRISVSSATNPSGTIDPQTKIFGVPEPIPEKTYMARSGLFTGDAPFINSGQNYHQNFNISFTSIESLEEIISDLQSNSTIFNHLRIFTHANQGFLGISLFRGGSGFVEGQHVDGFRTSELQGVLDIIQIYFVGGSGYFETHDLSVTFLNYLRANHSGVLIPFQLDAATAPFKPELVELFRRYIDLWLIHIPGGIQVVRGAATRNLTAAEMNDPFNALIEDTIVRLIKPPVVAVLPALIDDDFRLLKETILGITLANLSLTSPPWTWPFQDDPANSVFVAMMKDLRSVATALGRGNTFMTKLQHVKDHRFDSTSFIDIRGCNAGQGGSPPPLLTSLSEFFGNAGSLPTVDAPEWFQTFAQRYFHQPLANNTEIDNAFTSGYSREDVSLTPTEVLDGFTIWSDLSKVDEQFLFFTNLFVAGANLVDFASLRWRTWRLTGSTTGIPPLTLYSSRTDDLVQLQLGDLLNRLRENFTATGSNLAADVVTRLNSLQPKIENLKQVDEQLTAFSGSNFSTFYTSLSGLATQILTIPGMPAASTPLVPATMPGTLVRADITGYITNFNTYLTNFLNSGIGTIFSNIQTAIGLPNAKRYYYFHIRLPMRGQTANALINRVDYVVYYLAGQVGEAIKTYMKCQWTGTPSQISDMNTFIDGRAINDGNASSSNFIRATCLVEFDTTSNPFALAPLPDYASHIIST